MNEIIKQLLAQAHLDVMEDLGNIDTNQVAEKFAELLLKRAMSICEDLGDQGLDGHYCVDKIRKEFGL